MMKSLPPYGSLREALLLTVWLRRQEIELNRTRVYASLAGDFVGGNNNGTVKAFQEYFNSLYPYLAKSTKDDEKKLKETMRREIDKGAISFSTVVENPLRRAAEKFQLPDDFRSKLQKKVRDKKGTP